MPQKNVIKTYLTNGFYHLYNRGVDKRNIFEDNKDHTVFLHYLRYYLSPKKEKENPLPRTILQKNLAGEINLLTYCLMPNHFHLLVKQKSERAIEAFLRCLATSYVIYFNKRYNRVGHLFQGTYKAVLVENEEQLLYLSRYIHRNPLGHQSIPNSASLKKILESFYSSYKDYLGGRTTSWVRPELILSYFRRTCSRTANDLLSYQSFVEGAAGVNEKTLSIVDGLTLEALED